jgi:hypothetical protein
MYFNIVDNEAMLYHGAKRFWTEYFLLLMKRKNPKIGTMLICLMIKFSKITTNTTRAKIKVFSLVPKNY